MSDSTLPIIDLSRADDPSTAQAFRDDLRRVTHKIGFFYLTGHGIPAEDFGEIIDVAQRFFALPEEEKLAIENTKSPHFRGYTRTGGGERGEGRLAGADRHRSEPRTGCRSAVPLRSADRSEPVPCVSARAS